MNDDCLSDDGRGALGFQISKRSRVMGLAYSIRLQIAKVADVSLMIVWSRVRHGGGIKMASRRTGVRCGTIAFFVNVKAVRSGCQADDVGFHAQGVPVAKEVHSPS